MLLEVTRSVGTSMFLAKRTFCNPQDTRRTATSLETLVLPPNRRFIYHMTSLIQRLNTKAHAESRALSKNGYHIKPKLFSMVWLLFSCSGGMRDNMEILYVRQSHKIP